MNYDEAIKDLTSQDKFVINLGLDRISELLDLLGNPQDKIKCIQVAGTNGKGSVCTILASLLKEAGFKTGLYLSPHIFDYTERISINGIPISKIQFAKYYSMIVDLAEKNEIFLTEFEILTVIMFKYFCDEKAEVVIVETGLGGRFDATNVLKTNLCSVITHIDLDHTDRLGDTKEKIAFEKAGIIKPNSLVITAEGYEAIKDKSDEMNAMLILVSPCEDREYTEALSLKGEHQKENLSLALSAIQTIFPKINKQTILTALKKVKNPCRFQYIKEKNLIIDGAHNPNCFQALRKNLDLYFPNIKRNYIFGCLNTKNVKEMVSYIESDSELNELYIYQFNNPKSCTFKEISGLCSISCKELTDSREVSNIAKEHLTVICGSFYMINELIDEQYVIQL